MRASFQGKGQNESSVLKWDWRYYDLTAFDEYRNRHGWCVCPCLSEPVRGEDPEAGTDLGAASALGARISVSEILFSMKRHQGSLENWPVPRLGLGKCKMNLKLHFVSEWKCSKNDGGMSRGCGGWLEGAPAGHSGGHWISK